jgi:hypothetical protein
MEAVMAHHGSITTSLITVVSMIVSILSGLLPQRVGDFQASEYQLNWYPNLETVGITVSGPKLPQTAQLMYRQSGETEWQTGHPFVRIDDGRLVGSLFGLAAATTYEVKVIVGSTELNGATTTQTEELPIAPTTILHVNDDAPAGGDGSAAAPFKTIQEAVNRAAPGMQVLVADGVYNEAVTFPNSGNVNQWIQVKAEGGGAILDGSEHRTGKIWTPHPTRARVWFMQLGSPIVYLARDGQRYYKYDDLAGLLQTRGHGGVTINEGWFYDPSRSRLYVRSQDDPSSHTWQIPRRNYAFDINSRDWLWIEGFEVRFYGATTSGCGICALNASHIVIRKNKIHNMQLGVYINWTGADNQGNDTRIEYNEIYDPNVDRFPWTAVKGSSMEGTGIVVRGHIGAIVRGNDIHNFFNGIYTGISGVASQNPAIAFDVDVYNNHIHEISDDALEPEGACVNHRFRSNMIESTFVGVSLAPITQGPTWVLRSVIANYTKRSVKWALNSDGVVLLYHNTSWTNAANVTAMDLITPVRNSVMRNNIFRSTGYSFVEVPTGSTGNDWDYDNWYTTRGLSGYHFLWENRNYTNIAKLCAGTRLECLGHDNDPGFADPAAGDFTLLSSSPNIDRGIVIPGINDDFKGTAPDLGAYELTFDSLPTVTSIVRADTNPTNAASVSFTIKFSEAVTGVDTASPFNDFGLVASSGITNTSIASVTPVSGTTYAVRVNTGSGDGTLRLDVMDDDSILDASGQPLGGAGAGNGNFTNGETYTVKKSTANTIVARFKSAATYDGWILESGEGTGAGGTFDRNATTFIVGDDQKDRQYKSIVSFDTNSLPDNATIVSAQLKIKRQSVLGMDPFATHGALFLIMRNGTFGGSAILDASDFSAPVSSGTVADPFAALTSSWYVAELGTANLLSINKFGITQFRLFFSKDDNDDLGSDYVKFYSGNWIEAEKPELIVTYYVP